MRLFHLFLVLNRWRQFIREKSPSCCEVIILSTVFSLQTNVIPIIWNPWQNHSIFPYFLVLFVLLSSIKNIEINCGIIFSNVYQCLYPDGKLIPFQWHYSTKFLIFDFLWGSLIVFGIFLNDFQFFHALGWWIMYNENIFCLRPWIYCSLFF